MDEGFRIKKAEYVNRTFRLPKELVDRLAVAAQESGISTNELVVQSCEYVLDKLIVETDRKNGGRS